MSDETKNRWLPRALAWGVVAFGGALAGCGGGHAAPACTTQPAVAAEWTIERASDQQPLSCGGANAATVELTLDGTKYDFDCGAGQGLTTPLAPGDYDADFALLDPNGNVISQTQQMTVTVQDCVVTDLGTVPFDVN